MSHFTQFIRYANESSLPISGDTSVLYIADDTFKLYVWTGSAYQPTTSATEGWTGTVNTYADLPAASAHNGEVWLVTTSSGIWPLNKPAGLYISNGSSWTQAPMTAGAVIGTDATTDNCIMRANGTTGDQIQSSDVIIDDNNNITGVASIVIGDLGNNTAGIDIGGSVSNAIYKQGDINPSNVYNGIWVRNSTSYGNSFAFARSNSDTSSNAAVNNYNPLLRFDALGWTGSYYRPFAGMEFRVDDVTAVSDLNAPGRVAILVNIRNAIAYAEALTITSDLKTSLAGDLVVNGDHTSVGDLGNDTNGINFEGSTTNSTFKVGDVNTGALFSGLLKRNSTGIEPILAMARSNSDTATDASVTNGQQISTIYSLGYAGLNYKLFGSITNYADSTGTISNTSSPGKWEFSVTPDGSTIPEPFLTVTNDKRTTFSGSVICGDPGTEGGGINVGGITFNSSLKVSDINGTDYAQTILHRHSTTFESALVFARSNSDTTAHADITNSMNIGSIFGTGWAGSNYKIFSSISLGADSTGTISNTSAPGRILFNVTPNGSTTPAIALTIANDKSATFAGAVTMTSVKLAGATSGTITISAPAVAGTNTLTLPAGTTNFSATGGTSQVVKQTSAGGAFTVGQLAASDLSNGTTGSGAVALATSPSFTTPTLGVASATSINKVAITAPATSATLTIADGKTLTANNSITLSGTDATTMTFPTTSQSIAGLGVAQIWTAAQTFRAANAIRSEAASTQDAVIIAGRAGGTSSYAVTITPTTLSASRTLTLANGDTTLQAGTMAITGGTLAQFASTTSAQLAGVISDETGSGSLVFGTSPTFTTSIDSGATFGAFASSTALTLGYTGTGASSTTNISTAALTGAFTKTINIGTGGTTGSTTTINVGATGSTTTVNYGGLIYMNDYAVNLRNDTNHAIRWAGTGNLFASTNLDGPAVYGFSAGALGTTNGGQKIALYWNTSQYVGIGTTTPHAALQFANATNNRTAVLYETANNDHQYYGLGINANTFRYQVDASTTNHIFYAGTSTTTSQELVRITGDQRLGIGGTGAISRGRLAITGANASANGPHAEFFTASDSYPIYQILPWSHDNLNFVFDGYFDGTNWKSSDAGSNYLIAKVSDILSFKSDTGIAAGSNITWDNLMTISTAGVVRSYGYFQVSQTSATAQTFLDFDAQKVDMVLAANNDNIEFTFNRSGSDVNQTGVVLFSTPANGGGGYIAGFQFTGQGIQVGSPTGGNKGAGTINVATDIYKNNTAYTNPDYAIEQWATGKIELFKNNEGAAGYKLLTIEETAEYMRTNYQLPGRTRVHKDPGYLSGSEWVLEKLEEATIHIIELNNRIKQLENGSTIRLSN